MKSIRKPNINYHLRQKWFEGTFQEFSKRIINSKEYSSGQTKHMFEGEFKYLWMYQTKRQIKQQIKVIVK